MRKRLLSLVMALAMICGFAWLVPASVATAYNGGGIYNNGLGGIYINIYGSIYTDSRWRAYGNPYGTTGCTWFVGARVMEQTGKGSYNTQNCSSWYYSYGPNLGFTADQTPSDNCVICWSGHVAILEKIVGNTAYISEGGVNWSKVANNDYCRLDTCNVSEISGRNSGFIGYVHFGSSGTKPSWAKVSVPKSTFAVGEDITFTLTSDSGKAYTVGIDDASGNRIHTYGSPIRSDTTTQVYTYRISKPGNYSCYITAHNDIGLCDSDRIYFSVATKPSWAKVSIPKSTFTIGEDITFTLTSDSGKAYTVGIDDASGNRIHTYGSPIRSDTTTQVYTYRISKPGNYSCYITAHNDIGLCDSEKIYFKIAQPVDLGDRFYANITNNDLQKMTCSGDVTFDSTYKENDQIWYFIKQNDGSYMIQSLSSGAYNGWYLEVANGGTDPGTNISTMYKWLDDNPAQKWYVYGEQNAYILKPKCADLVVTSADNSLTGVSNAQLEKYTGNSNQLLEINKLCDKALDIHSYNEWTVNKKATCEENGQKQHKCIWCGNIEKDIINKLGHNYVETVVAPTSAEKGYTIHKCSTCGDEYKDNFTVLALKLTKQPTNVTVAKAGDKISFTVEATGTGLKYEWYIKDVGGDWKKTGAVTNQYDINLTTARNGRQVFCKVIDSSGKFVRSNIAVGNIAGTVIVVEQPKDVTVWNAGDTANFTVKGAGHGLKYEWYVKDPGGNWIKTGAVESTYSISISKARNGRQVFCKIIDFKGRSVRTNVVKANIAGTVVIMEQPKNVTVAKAGDTATFTIKSVGHGMKYEWYVKDPKGNWTKTGATTNKYSVSITKARNGRQVFCKVIDFKNRSVRSNIVTAKIK